MPEAKFTSKRTRCPDCQARRGIATTTNGDTYCHSCGKSTFKAPRLNVTTQFNTNYQTIEKEAPKRFIDLSTLLQLYRNPICNLQKYCINRFGKLFARHIEHGAPILSDKAGNTLFIYYDEKGNPRTIKAVKYNQTGKRIKSDIFFGYFDTNTGNNVYCKSTEGYYNSLFFGLHQLSGNYSFYDYRNYNFDTKQLKKHSKSDPIIIVESEKTSLIAKFFFPNFIWLACGGAAGITHKKIEFSYNLLKNRNIKIVFDNDKAGEENQYKAYRLLKHYGLKVQIINTKTLWSDANISDDISDYLLQLKKEDINKLFYTNHKELF